MHYINNLGSQDDEFFCYGITDSINIELNKINNLAAPSSASILKIKDLEEIKSNLKNLYLQSIKLSLILNIINNIKLTTICKTVILHYAEVLVGNNV